MTGSPFLLHENSIAPTQSTQAIIPATIPGLNLEVFVERSIFFVFGLGNLPTVIRN
jgi:hypothetical protein